MDPRSLVGPTLIVLGVSIALVCSLFLINPAAPELSDFHRPRHARDTVGTWRLIEDVSGSVLRRKLVYGIIVAIGLCCVPLGDSAGGPKMNWLVKALIFSIIVLVATFFSGDVIGSFGAMLRVLLLGVAAIVFFWISSLFKKSPSTDKGPAHLAWSSDRRPQPPPDDPVVLDRLEHWRAVVGQGPSRQD